jgi:hypothetical protein
MILGWQSWRAFYNAASQPESDKFDCSVVSRETLDPRKSFHVKRKPQRMNVKMNIKILLTYTKFSKDDVKYVLHIDPAE